MLRSYTTDGVLCDPFVFAFQCPTHMSCRENIVTTLRQVIFKIFCLRMRQVRNEYKKIFDRIDCKGGSPKESYVERSSTFQRSYVPPRFTPNGSDVPETPAVSQLDPKICPTLCCIDCAARLSLPACLRLFIVPTLSDPTILSLGNHVS